MKYDTLNIIINDFYSLAAEKDAKELMKINLSQIPKNIPQDQDLQEYYQLLNEQAKDGPIFNRQTIEYVHNLSEAILPNNRKPFVKWLANQRQSGVNISNNDIITIKDYLNNVDVNLDKISFPELLELSNNWHTEEFEIQENTGPYKTKDVVYSFDNGYTIVKVPSEDLGTEGAKMGHCAGGYCDEVYSGKKEIYSLRDSKNEPHVTIELSGNKIEQIKGKEDKPPIEAYAQMVKKWLFDTFEPEQFVYNEDYVISLPFEDILEMIRVTPEDEVNWIDISKNKNLTEDFIRAYKDKLDWFWVSHYQQLSEEFIRELQDKVDWNSVSMYQKLSEDFIREFQNKVAWYLISINQKLSENFIREFQDKVNWRNVSIYQKLSEDFIQEFQDKLDWSNISIHQKLSEGFIRKFEDKLDWTSVSGYQKLSEDFIREFEDKVNWNSIFSYQQLSEPFIREFQDKVDWYYISKYQKLSEDFIREFQNKVDWDWISFYQELSEPFINEFWLKLDKSSLLENKNISDDIKNKIREKMKKAALFNIVDKFYKISQISAKELSSIPKSDTDLMEEAVRSNDQVAIKRLQQILLSFPWKELGYAKPNISINGKIDDSTVSAINWLSQIGNEIGESSLSKMKDFVSNNDYFNAQSMAYVGKQALVNALNQPQNIPKELLDKYPGLRKWTQKEMMDYLKKSPYPGYFPKPWSISRLGKRDWAGNWNCEGDQCQKSYYESFMSWGPGKQGIELIYDPRLSRNMDKYPNIWSSRAIKYRAQNNISSPHIPSPGVGEWIDVNNLPKGKQFMDDEDKKWYLQLLRLYNQFIKEEKERGTSYILPP